MANMTFTVRISPQDHELLVSLAAIRNQTVAELSREILANGIRMLLDPVEIDKRLNAERERLLTAAARIRKEVAQSHEVGQRAASRTQGPGRLGQA